MAYVKTDWENLPSTDTPITDTALDNMENGIEYNDQRLNGTKPINNTICANDFKCKNIANIINFTQTANQASTYQPIGSVYLEAGTYTLSWTQSDAMASNARNTPGYYIGSTTVFQTQSTNANMEAGRHSWTFTIETAGFYNFRWWINVPSTTVDMTDFMLEIGSEATSYTPYKSFGEEIYSTNEMVIGRWVDGKPVYRKVFDFGALPNNTTKSISHDISNLEYVVSLRGFTKETSSNRFIIPFVSQSNLASQIGIYANNTSIAIQTGTDRSSYSAYVIIEYTKASSSSRSIQSEGE